MRRIDTRTLGPALGSPRLRHAGRKELKRRDAGLNERYASVSFDNLLERDESL